MKLQLERIYTKPADLNGYRILVDRLWPRGISKATAHLDAWEKAIAPSPALRKWFNHDPSKFSEFAKNYQQELNQNPATAIFINEVAQRLATQNVILLYGAKDQKHNQAVVLFQYLQNLSIIQTSLSKD
ncbi:putative uroporphyrin-III c-methyltransferase [Fructilactobacillus florum 8D]|uniref:Putative uroporphyrin-III c-methyltransferase n=1 Tax=Fructilactobacillus florum 8D TaxID=1221538 RepID=W9EF18_9LACO|nr:DUF488 domain-containing protein [Fructilactobacillus florum]EKK21138.1 putative uroporphyrin-III c-methyltransferase [Fructilactobacillus florum 2F]ETO40728.1 putative uroporphyrin-III c-methyltransferase [Fructilactobacillus florum 8D]